MLSVQVVLGFLQAHDPDVLPCIIRFYRTVVPKLGTAAPVCREAALGVPRWISEQLFLLNNVKNYQLSRLT